MKPRKIRGNSRLQKQVLGWIAGASFIDMNFLFENKYWYADLIVYPWCDISIIKSEIQEPKSATRNLIISALEEIYNNWKLQLDKLNEPYYLKIWLYEPRVSKSQVVCAIGERIEYYNNNFVSVNVIRKKSDFCNKLSSEFEWDSFEDSQIWSEEDLCSPIELYRNIEDYNESLRFLVKIKKANYKTLKIDTLDGSDTLHVQPKGVIWIGDKK